MITCEVHWFYVVSQMSVALTAATVTNNHRYRVSPYSG